MYQWKLNDSGLKDSGGDEKCQKMKAPASQLTARNDSKTQLERRREKVQNSCGEGLLKLSRREGESPVDLTAANLHYQVGFWLNTI